MGNLIQKYINDNYNYLLLKESHFNNKLLKEININNCNNCNDCNNLKKNKSELPDNAINKKLLQSY
jgi:hypothetical protein